MLPGSECKCLVASTLFDNEYGQEKRSSRMSARGAGKQAKARMLEGDLEGQLNATRASAAEERVADADVAGGGDGI